jgi:hypothetical protein
MCCPRRQNEDRGSISRTCGRAAGWLWNFRPRMHGTTPTCQHGSANMKHPRTRTSAVTVQLYKDGLKPGRTPTAKRHAIASRSGSLTPTWSSLIIQAQAATRQPRLVTSSQNSTASPPVGRPTRPRLRGQCYGRAGASTTWDGV